MPDKIISKQLLANMAIIRPILIVLLVFYHAFAIFSGGWESIDSYPEIKAYWWLDKLSYAFMLEMFVFVSGFVFGYQVRTKGYSKLEAKNLFFSKFKRLIIPSFIFSFIYILLLEDISQPISKTLYDIINGAGHLWFLPMLFWCFAGVWLIEKTHLKPRYVFPLLLFCSIVIFMPLPLQIGQSLYFLFFFYLGYTIQRYEVKLDRFYTVRAVIILVLQFMIIFPILTIFVQFFTERGSGDCQLILKFFYLACARIAKLLYSTVGLLMLLSIIGLIDKKQNHILPKWIISIGTLCMGVYIFQQFILKLLYYHSEIPESFSPYLLPWMGFVIALFGALLLSYLLRKTKFGRFLIG